MTLQELRRRLREERFDSDIYWIGSDDGWRSKNDCHCLLDAGDHWELFYTERGARDAGQRFRAESDACDAYWALLSGSPTFRRHMIAFVAAASRAELLREALAQEGIATEVDAIPYSRGPNGTRHRVFVDGRDLDRAFAIRARLAPGSWHD